ncbi:MAG: hypothetical protein U9N84_12020 [Actinomycetota bacterium]|nr:hypothetical protein [Actinomycetota bacterium]
MTSALRFGAGLLVGALVSGAASLIWFGPDTEVVAATTLPTSITPTSATPVAPWFEEGEALVDATVILPGPLETDDGVVIFEYELVGLSPALVEHEDAEHGGDIVVLPEKWVLTTGGGAEVEAVTGPRDQSVRFELVAPDDLIATIHLVGWRVATPFGDRVEIPVESGTSGSLRSGELTIVTVLDQTNSTIVQFDFERSGGDWEFDGLPRPLDPGWRLSGRDGGFQLIWDGDDAPELIVLENGAFEWRPATGNILVLDTGIAP